MEERLLAMQKAVGSNPISRSLDILLICVTVETVVDYFKTAVALNLQDVYGQQFDNHLQ